MPEEQIVPEYLIAEIEAALRDGPTLHPQMTIVPKELRDAFEKHDTQARACMITRNQFEAVALMNFYLIWRNQEWRAAYETWEEYCDDIEREPLGLPKSTLKHKVGDIHNLVEKGAKLDLIMNAIVKQATATHELAMLPEPELPHPDINATLERWAELAPGEAKADLDIALGRTRFVCKEAAYVEQDERFLFTLVVLPPNAERYERDLEIPMVDSVCADYLFDKLKPKKRVVFAERPNGQTSENSNSG